LGGETFIKDPRGKLGGVISAKKEPLLVGERISGRFLLDMDRGGKKRKKTCGRSQLPKEVGVPGGTWTRDTFTEGREVEEWSPDGMS